MADVGSIGVDDAEKAAGAVTLCGPVDDVAAATPAVRRFNVARPRFQASTIAFPGGPARAARELANRARAASRECDVYAVAAADVPALAQRGWLANLQPYVEERAKDAPFDAVRAGTDAFGVRLAGGGADGPVLVVAAASRTPGAALALLDALSGGTATEPDP
jgi:hypothetical protein